MPGICARPAFLRNARDVRIVAMLAAFDRRGHRVAAGGEVQVDRDLAGERRRDVGERAADRRRQQQADRRLAGCVATDGAREQQAADQRAAEGQLAAGRIGHAERRPLPLGGAEEAGAERVAVGANRHAAADSTSSTRARAQLRSYDDSGSATQLTGPDRRPRRRLDADLIVTSACSSRRAAARGAGRRRRSAPPRATATAARAPARRRRRTGSRRRSTAGQSRICASIQVWFLRTRHTRSARSGGIIGSLLRHARKRRHAAGARHAAAVGAAAAGAAAAAWRDGGVAGGAAADDCPAGPGLLQRLEVDQRQIVGEHRAELVGLAPARGRAAPGSPGSSSTCRPRTACARRRAAARRARAPRASSRSAWRSSRSSTRRRAPAGSRAPRRPSAAARACERSSLRARVVGLVAALADRIRHADADAPTSGSRCANSWSEHRAERRDRARADDRAGEAAGAQHLRAAEAARLIAGVQPHVGQPLIAGVLHARLRVLDVLARAQQIGALARARAVTAASTSTAAVPTGGESTGSIWTFQFSRSVGSKISSAQPILGLLHRRSRR